MVLPQVFFEVHAGLPRQGVGSDESTLRALELCAELPASPDVLDIGCGPGAQTVALARAIGRARDRGGRASPPFLEELRERARAAGVGDRIAAIEADMRDLPFEPGSFDLLWSEGAAYIMGISEALAAWRPLLPPGRLPRLLRRSSGRETSGRPPWPTSSWATPA